MKKQRIHFFAFFVRKELVKFKILFRKNYL